MSKRVTWEQIKSLSQQTKTALRYVEHESLYEISIGNPEFAQHRLSKEPSADLTDFETNFKDAGNKPLEPQTDKDGATVTNPKFAADGRVYQSLHFEIVLGQVGSLYCKDKNGTDVPFVFVMYYKAGDVQWDPENDDPSLIVRTDVLMAPPFTYDIQGFCLYQKQQPTTDIRAWAIGLPFLPVQYGGPKTFISGLNLAMAPSGIGFMDYVGDSASTIEYLGQGSNEQLLIFRHDSAVNHRIMGEVFWYV